MLRVRELVKRIGHRTIFSGVSFDLDAGEALVVRGPNGAGKTTLLRILAGISRPSGGSVRLTEAGLNASAASRRAITGYLGHEPFVYPELTGRENLLFYARVYDMPHANLDPILASWGLASAADQPARVYSRGMRQRLSLARLALQQPGLLLLDEPTTSLDAAGRDKLLKLVHEVRERGGAAVIAGHEEGLAGWFSARAVTLQSGRLVVES